MPCLQDMGSQPLPTMSHVPPPQGADHTDTASTWTCIPEGLGGSCQRTQRVQGLQGALLVDLKR